MNKFRIIYEDQAEDAIEKISLALASHGLKIERDGEGGDGYVDYKIVRTVDEEKTEEN